MMEKGPQSSSLVYIQQCHPDLEEDDFYLPIPAKKATKAKFPLNCKVLFCHGSKRHQRDDYEGKEEANIPPVLYGTVVELGILFLGLGEQQQHQRRQNLYRIQVDNTPVPTTFIVSEQVLQYAFDTPVWVSLPLFGLAEWQQAVVMGSMQSMQLSSNSSPHQQPNENKISYSVKVLAQQTIYHGVPGNHICFRSNETPPQIPDAILTLAGSVRPAINEGINAVAQQATRGAPSPSVSVSSLPLATETTNSTNSQRKLPTIKRGYTLSKNTQLSSPSTTVTDVSNNRSPRNLAPGGRGRGATLPAWLTRQQTALGKNNEATPTTQPIDDIANPPTNNYCDIQEQPQQPQSQERDPMQCYNDNPSPLQYIQVSDKHDIVSALQKLREWRQHKGLDMSRGKGVGDVLDQQCLHWQLTGKCSPNCQNLTSHQTMTVPRTIIFEKALLPVASADGPIYCKTAVSLPAEAGEALRYVTKKRQREELQDASPSRMRKRATKLQFEPEIAVIDDKVVPMSQTYKLPGNLGYDFYMSTLNEYVMQGFCNTFECSIDMKYPPADVRNSVLSVKIKAHSIPKAFQCITAVEDELFKALPNALKGYMLHTVGMWNNHRLKYGDIVNSRERYICLMEASDYPVVARDIISYEQADRFFNQALKATFPDCRMQIYKPSQQFPLIDPHVALYGPDMNSVRDCRAKMLEWLKEESGDNAQEAIDTTNTTYDTYNESSRHKEIDDHAAFNGSTNFRGFDRSRRDFDTSRKRTISRNSLRRNSDRDMDTTTAMPQGKRRHSNSDKRSSRARYSDRYNGEGTLDDHSLSSNSRVSDARKGHLKESRSKDDGTERWPEATVEQRKEQPQSGQSANDGNKLTKGAEVEAQAISTSQSDQTKAQNQKKKNLFDDESSDEEPIPGEYDGPDEF